MNQSVLSAFILILSITFISSEPLSRPRKNEKKLKDIQTATSTTGSNSTTLPSNSTLPISSNTSGEKKQDLDKKKDFDTKPINNTINTETSDDSDSNDLDCDPIYLRFSSNHTACKDYNDKCNITKEGISPQERNEILDIHNSLRNKLASGGEKTAWRMSSASNMMKLEWDEELAMVSQSHANQCDFNHDCNNCREVDNFPVGQNLYQRRTSWLNPKANWTKAIQSFYDEISFTPQKVMSRFKGGAYGHFTQLVWAKTWRIGCGYSAYRINEPPFKIEELYVCNYGPSGNIRNKRVYSKGKPVVRCPINTSPSTNYSSLCEADDPRGPLEIDAEAVRASNRTLLFCDFSTDHVCGLRVTHQNNSHLVSTISGSYLSFILSPGQEAMIHFPASYKSKKGFCVETNQRKGANFDGDEVTNKLMMTLKIPSMNWFTEVESLTNSIEWMKSSTDVNWSHETLIRITFSVPKTATSDQFYEIKNIRIYEGKCVE